MAKDSTTFSRLILSILLLTSTSCVFAQWSGSGPRWNYNGRETMYVGRLQTTGSEGFSFAYNWRFFPGAIEMWPETFFKSRVWVKDRVIINNNTGGGGYLEIVGEYLGPAVRLSTQVNDGGGSAVFFNGANEPKAGIRGDTGEVWGAWKSFIVPHPNNEDVMIRYTALEGPTPDMYIRGSVVLSAGRATVEFPEHFAALANPENITISLTPWSADSLGVAVDYSDQKGFQIVELHQGAGEYRVDYVVHALRAGYEDYGVYLSRYDTASSTTKSVVLSGEQGEVEIAPRESFLDYLGDVDVSKSQK